MCKKASRQPVATSCDTDMAKTGGYYKNEALERDIPAMQMQVAKANKKTPIIGGFILMLPIVGH